MLGAIASSYKLSGSVFIASDYGTVWAEWDFSDTGTITDAGGGAVSAVSDKSGNGRGLSQGTSGRRPTTGTRTIGGLNAIDFDGSDDSLNRGVTTLSQRFYIVAIAQSDNVDTTLDYIIGGSGGGIPQLGTSGGSWRMSGGTTLADGTDDANPHLFVADFNGASSSLRIDGAASASGDAGTQGFSAEGMDIGNAANTGQWNGTIGHIIIYSAVTDLSGLESALMTKWGL